MKSICITFLTILGLGILAVVRAQHQQSVFLPADILDLRQIVPNKTIALEARLGAVSVGLELVPTKKTTGSRGYGGYWGYEYYCGEKFGITSQAGFIKLGVNDTLKTFQSNLTNANSGTDLFLNRAYMVPWHIGVNYFLNRRGQGIYTHLSFGAHSFLFEMIGFSKLRWSETYVSGVIGIGYIINKKIDLGLCLKWIAADNEKENSEAAKYLGIRCAFILPTSN